MLKAKADNVDIIGFVEGCRSAPGYRIELFAKNALDAVKSCMLTPEGKALIERQIEKDRLKKAAGIAGG